MQFGRDWPCGDLQQRRIVGHRRLRLVGIGRGGVHPDLDDVRLAGLHWPIAIECCRLFERAIDQHAAAQEDGRRLGLSVGRILVGVRRAAWREGQAQDAIRLEQVSAGMFHVRASRVDRHVSRRGASQCDIEAGQHELVERQWLLLALRGVDDLARLGLIDHHLVERHALRGQLVHRRVHAEQDRHLDQ